LLRYQPKQKIIEMSQSKPDELALTISGWPLSFDNDQVVAVLKDVCDVTECELLKPEAGAEDLAAIVHFADAESAAKAAENVHGLGVSALRLDRWRIRMQPLLGELYFRALKIS
jgi:hypothetical protein